MELTTTRITGTSITAAGIAKTSPRAQTAVGLCRRCPVHDDHNPSLSLKDSEDGRVLVKCHAGCEQAAVVAALKSLGLWAEKKPRQARIAATYDYTDETGQILYRVVRTEPKGFFQRRPDGHGGWIWKQHPRQVLYHLPEVIENPIMFVAEGEKDCEALRDHGFVATTNSGGAGKWREEFNQYFRGKEVLILPDADRQDGAMHSTLPPASWALPRI